MAVRCSIILLAMADYANALQESLRGRLAARLTIATRTMLSTEVSLGFRVIFDFFLRVSV